jgi:hypothetical protein
MKNSSSVEKQTEKNTGEKKKTLRLKRLRGCDNRRTKIRNTIVAASGGIPSGL